MHVMPSIVLGVLIGLRRPGSFVSAGRLPSTSGGRTSAVPHDAGGAVDWRGPFHEPREDLLCPQNMTPRGLRCVDAYRRRHFYLSCYRDQVPDGVELRRRDFYARVPDLCPLQHVCVPEVDYIDRSGMWTEHRGMPMPQIHCVPYAGVPPAIKEWRRRRNAKKPKTSESEKHAGDEASFSQPAAAASDPHEAAEPADEGRPDDHGVTAWGRWQFGFAPSDPSDSAGGTGP